VPSTTISTINPASYNQKTVVFTSNTITNPLFGVSTLLLSYQNPLKDASLGGLTCSGSVFGEYTLKIDSTAFVNVRSGPSRTLFIPLYGLFLKKDSIFEVFLLHFRQNTPLTFDASLMGSY